MLPRVQICQPLMGCDPEFFFTMGGKVIGAEKVIPKAGMHQDYNGKPQIIIDGVQAELNPVPATCREGMAYGISRSFYTLKETLKDKKDVKVDFSRTVEITKENLDDLSEDSKRFGCAPSASAYKTIKSLMKIDKVDPEKYRTRAAGGHIHIGMGKEQQKKHKEMVILLDLICGNTCVLVDRDKSNIERRKLYGRAGEFRLPEHGLEYRTLSNFWLTSYQLMSLSFGMARLAYQLTVDSSNSKMFFNEFTSKVKQKNVQNAINNNDFDLAMENFKAIEPLLLEVISNTSHHPIGANNIKEFHHFVNKINKEGLEYFFKEDPMTHWIRQMSARGYGFSDYLVRTVRQDMKVA